MSLPSIAKFYKNGQLVKELHCNCGYWWHGDMDRLYDNIIETYNSADRETELEFEWDEFEAYGSKISLNGIEKLDSHLLSIYRG